MEFSQQEHCLVRPQLLNRLVLPSALALTIACGTDGNDSSSTTPTGPVSGMTQNSCGLQVGGSVRLEWDDDGVNPTDTDGDGLADTGCQDTLHIEMWTYYRSAEPTMRVGIVDTFAGVWTGEDCLTGDAPGCHSIPSSHTLHQTADCSTNVILGSSTHFDASRSAFLTYLFTNECDCVVLGADVAYYDSLGCTEI